MTNIKKILIASSVTIFVVGAFVFLPINNSDNGSFVTTTASAFDGGGSSGSTGGSSYGGSYGGDSGCGGCGESPGGGGYSGGGGEGQDQPPPARCEYLTASPTTLPYGGGNVTLSWKTTYAQVVTIDNGIGNVGATGSKTVNVTSSKTFTITAKSTAGNESCTASVTVQPPPKPPAKCDYLTVSPTTLPHNGGQVTIKWATTNATGVTITGLGGVAASGTEVVTVNQDTTFNLSATGAGGNDSCAASVVVEPKKEVAKCDFLSASRTTVPHGGANVTLSWETTNATGVSINNGVGSVAADGSKTVFVDSNTTFVLTATGAAGNDTCSVSITKETEQAPRCDYLRIVGDSNVEEGDEITLEWETTNANDVRIEPQLGSVSVDGSKRVTVYDDETFTLRARNTSTGKESTCTVSVNVEEEEDEEPRPRCDLEVSRDRVNPGEKITLSWDTKNTDEIRIRDNHGNTIFESDRSKYMDGEIDVVIYKSTEFTLRAEGDGGSRTCRVDVKTDDLAVYEKRDQGYVIALTQVPYTGFEAGPVLAFLFYAILVLWALFVAYILVIKKGSVMGFSLYGNGQGATASDIANRKKVEALVEKYSGRL